MTVTRAVIEDLLPAYLAGEASADTVRLVEEFAAADPDFARTVASLRAAPLPELPESPGPTLEKETLDRTKRLLRWRANLMGLAIFLTLLPFSFADLRTVKWQFMRDMPPAATAAVWISALACWIAFFLLRRRLRVAGL
jgi:hypothetical protein